ncbi:hypothetical protein L9F63_005461, partial [Diploptera punctata]
FRIRHYIDAFAATIFVAHRKKRWLHKRKTAAKLEAVKRVRLPLFLDNRHLMSALCDSRLTPRISKRLKFMPYSLLSENIEKMCITNRIDNWIVQNTIRPRLWTLCYNHFMKKDVKIILNYIPPCLKFNIKGLEFFGRLYQISLLRVYRKHDRSLQATILRFLNKVIPLQSWEALEVV